MSLVPNHRNRKLGKIYILRVMPLFLAKTGSENTLPVAALSHRHDSKLLTQIRQFMLPRSFARHVLVGLSAIFARDKVHSPARWHRFIRLLLSSDRHPVNFHSPCFCKLKSTAMFRTGGFVLAR